VSKVAQSADLGMIELSFCHFQYSEKILSIKYEWHFHYSRLKFLESACKNLEGSKMENLRTHLGSVELIFGSKVPARQSPSLMTNTCPAGKLQA
jgi:hypothetical protein